MVDGAASAEGEADGAGCPEGMVEIPAGTFTMGHPEALRNDDIDADGVPHQVTLSKAFCIDRAEVTQAEYKRCMDAGRCLEPQSGIIWDKEAAHPVSGLTWMQAENYCAQQGKRLPTEAEWEYAARGSDGSVYPWGNETDVKSRGPRGKTGPAGGDDGDVSSFGVRGMATNISEWVWDWYQPYGPEPQRDPKGPIYPHGLDRREKVFRGGNHDRDVKYAAAAIRSTYEPSRGLVGPNGVRCARDKGAAQPNEAGQGRLAALWLDIQVRRVTPQQSDLAAPTPRATATWAAVCQSVPECARGCEQSLAELTKVPVRFGEGRCAALESGSEAATRAELERRLRPLFEQAKLRLSEAEREVLNCDLFLSGFSADQGPCFRMEGPWLISNLREWFQDDYFDDPPYFAKLRCSFVPSCAQECAATLRSHPGNRFQHEVARQGCVEIRSQVSGLSDDAAALKLFEWGRERWRRHVEDFLSTLDATSEDAHVVRCWLHAVKFRKEREPNCEGARAKEPELPDWLKNAKN